MTNHQYGRMYIFFNLDSLIYLFIYLYILITQADMLYAFTWMDGEMFISDF